MFLLRGEAWLANMLLPVSFYTKRRVMKADAVQLHVRLPSVVGFGGAARVPRPRCVEIATPEG